MADLDFDIDVSGVEQTMQRLEDDFKDGIEDGIEDLLDLGKQEARTTVRLHDRIFNREVYNGFKESGPNWTSPTSAEGTVRNIASHAHVVEYGADYDVNGPPVEALIPWVERKLGGWDIMDGGPQGGASPQTPHAGQQSDDDLDVDADWTQFHNDRYDGDTLWTGQRLVMYDPDEDKYVEATVTSVNWRGHIEIDRDDGLTDSLDWRDGTLPDGYGIAAGEDWYSLSDDDQRTILKSMYNDMDIDSSFSSSYRDDIDASFGQYIANTKDPTMTKRLLMGISNVDRDDNMSARGQWIGTEVGGSINLNETNSDISTIRHEIGHAVMTLHGYEYATGARHWDDSNGEQWDSIKQFRKGSLPWNYDSIDKQYWETGQADPLPHPTTYMLHHRDDRDGVGLYDDVDDGAWDEFNDFVHKDTKFKLQKNDDDSPPDYDPYFTEERVFDPESGAASSGDALWIAHEPDDGQATDFHVKIESWVHKKSDEPGYAVDISQDGKQKTLDITENGRIDNDDFVFYGYLMDGADELDGGDGNTLDADDVPNDPGFYSDADETMERLREGLNRQVWREMLATELGDYDQKRDWYLRGDGYSAVNAHETMAHFMALIFSDDPSADYKIQQLLDQSPLLIYAGAQVFEYSDEMKDALEKHTGLDFDDLLLDIWQEFVK